MSDQNSHPVIVVRKKGSHGGHHGGAWKVAYADFVTAMMALFIVLWLMSSSEKIRKAISAYFRDPSGTGQHAGSATTGTGETVSVNKENMASLKEELEQALKRSPEFEKLKDYIQMSVTGEGLRVELIESEKGIFFQSGSPVPTGVGKDLIVELAGQLGKLENDLLIEGHTDARPFGGKLDYTNWELSTDRANAARRLMESNGVRTGQVVQVRGFASQNLRDKSNPEATSNRRVSVIVRYKNVDELPGAPQAAAKAESEP